MHGPLRAGDRDVKLPQIRLSGENIAFKLELPVGGKPTPHQFQGKVNGDAIDGTVTFNDGTGQRTVPWKAKQTQRGELKLGSAGALDTAGAE